MAAPSGPDDCELQRLLEKRDKIEHRLAALFQEQERARLDRKDKPLPTPSVTSHKRSNLIACPSSFSSPFFFSRDDSTGSMSSSSDHSMRSMTSSDTIDTVNPEVLFPGVQWDETPNSKDIYSFEMDTASNDSASWLECHLAKSLDVTDQSSLSTKSKLNYLPSQALADINQDMNASIYLFDEAIPFTRKGLGPYTFSNHVNWHEQDADHSRCVGSESKMERREHQIPVSQNRDTAPKLKVADLPPQQYASRSINSTTSVQDLIHYQQKTTSTCSISASDSETHYLSSDNDTDWGDGESDDEHRTIGMPAAIEGSKMLADQKVPNFITKSVLSKLKQELVDRIMLEFWQIFNQEKEINIQEETISPSTCLHQCQESDPSPHDEQDTTKSSKSSTNSNMQINGTRPNEGQNSKRKRQGQDDDENDETENRNPKRPKGLLSSPQIQAHISKFACPYRKHDAKKYCVRHWRSCALTPLETVARVKGHLYRHHRIFQCQRCKTLFNNQQEVNNHLKEPEGCELFEVAQQDGITNEIVERLRSKKKAHRDQSEEDRWKEIYQIIFPGEMVPSPFFEEIQEDVIQSPDSRELADYEEYCRRELPRVFRASLEEVVNNNTQPLEEQLRSQLMELIRDAQDRVFSSYRSSSCTNTRTPVKGAPGSSPNTIPSSSQSQRVLVSPRRSQPAVGSPTDRSRARLPAFFQPPSPQSHLESSLDISDRNVDPLKPGHNDRSDSGYGSNSFALRSLIPSTPGDCPVNASFSSLQTFPRLDMSQETTGHAYNEVVLTQAKVDSNEGAMTGDGNGHVN